MKVLRDPVHGDILIGPELITLLDTPEFQRLRQVKMLGTAYLVYPGAVHSRFEHSLGTYWLTHQLFDLIRQRQPDALDPELRLAVEASALLHDVTHIPFGHTFEDERRIFERHDTPGRIRRFLPGGQLGKALKKLKILDSVLLILTEEHSQPWTYEIFSGTVCADLLDYLRRDAHFCGLPQSYDGRIFRHFRCSSAGHIYLDAQKNGLLRQDVVSEVVNLLRLRYFLSERVYFHHTKTATGAMISRAVEQAVNLGLTLSELSRLGDERLLAHLEVSYGTDPVVKSLLGHLDSRQVYKRAYVLTRGIGEQRRREFVERFHLRADLRAQAEQELCRRLKLKAGELIIYCPAFGMQLKEAEVLLKVDQDSAPRSMAEMAVPEIEVLRQKHQELWKFYVFIAPARMKQADKISRACEEYFLQPNHLPRLQSGQLYLSL